MADATAAAIARPPQNQPSPNQPPPARPPLTRAQRIAARVIGVITLAAMAVSFWIELVGLAPLVISDDPAVTAASLAQAALLVRASAVLGLICFISDVAVGVGYYAVLSPVSRGLAAFGALLRVGNAIVLALSALALLVVLRLVSDAPYLDAVPVAQQQAAARFLLGARSDTMSFGWVFLGLGQAVFAWLWLRSRYIPRALAIWGLFASTALALLPLAIMIHPALGRTVGVAYMAPMFLYEVSLGLLLLIRGVRDR